MTHFFKKTIDSKVGVSVLALDLEEGEDGILYYKVEIQKKEVLTVSTVLTESTEDGRTSMLIMVQLDNVQPDYKGHEILPEAMMMVVYMLCRYFSVTLEENNALDLKIDSQLQYPECFIMYDILKASVQATSGCQLKDTTTTSTLEISSSY